MLILEREIPQAPVLHDAEAFGRIYERYYGRIYAFAFSKLGNRSDCEDAVQETFTAVFESLDSFEGKASLLNWIYGVARNVINNQIRRAQSEIRIQTDRDNGITRSENSLDMWNPEQKLGLRRCSDAVETQLKEVSSWQARAFEMRHFNDIGIDEIADEVDRSNYAVRCGLYRVKQLVYDAVYP